MGFHVLFEASEMDAVEADVEPRIPALSASGAHRQRPRNGTPTKGRGADQTAVEAGVGGGARRHREELQQVATRHALD